MLGRLFPARLENEGYRGRVAALWLFALFLVLRAIMGVNGAVNTRAIATGDGLRLDGLGEGAAETILLLFRSLSLAQLPLVAIGAVVLSRWRAMVPFLYLVLLADQVVRRLVALTNAAPRTEAAAVGVWINLALLALLLAGLALSLWSRPGTARPPPAP
jgi:glucan phosphoethanolaminetransferase (alkaline phosphatase superfamily)